MSTSSLQGPPASVAKLTVIKGPGAGDTYDFGVGEFRIGRADEADVSLADADVSRFHAQLAVTLEGARLRDLDSKNGVRVNGRELESGGVATLAHGSTFELGGVTLELEHPNDRVRGELAADGHLTYTRSLRRNKPPEVAPPDLRAPAIAALCFALVIVGLLAFGN